MANSFIPQPDAGFAAWAQNFGATTAANPAAYGMTAPDAAAIVAAAAAFVAALAVLADPSTATPTAVTAKDEARATAETLCREWAAVIQADPDVTNPNRISAGLPVWKTTRTAIPAPVTYPNLGLRSLQPGWAEFGYQDSAVGVSGKAKPFGAVSMEVAVAYGVAPAVDPDAAVIVGAYTKSPFRLDFQPTQRGKIATIWGRWRTASGPGGKSQTGPWGPSTSVTVA